MKKKLHVAIAVSVFWSISLALPAADFGIGVFLKKNTGFITGDPVEFYVSGFNKQAAPETVDIHVGILAPDGNFYEYPDWNQQFVPWLPSFSLPANFRLTPTFIDKLNTFPGGLQPGAYQLVAGFTRPGTLDITSLDGRSFLVADPSEDWTNQGISFFRGDTPATVPTGVVVSANTSFSRVKYDRARLAEHIRSTEPVIESCLYNELPRVLEVVVGEANLTSLDAGNTLHLIAPGLVVRRLDQLVLNNGDLTYASGDLPASNYQAGKLYTVTGAGGPDIGPFSIDAVAPQLMSVTAPNLASAQAEIDTSQPLTVSWNGNDGIGEVMVVLSASLSLEAPQEVICRFADDGQAQIPAALLARLQTALLQNSPELPAIPGIDIPDSLLSPTISISISRQEIDHVSLGGQDFLSIAVGSAVGGTSRLR
jgi:hypothetical protein